MAEDSMAKLCLLVVVLLLAEVSSRSYSRFEFRGDVLVNNSYTWTLEKAVHCDAHA